MKSISIGVVMLLFWLVLNIGLWLIKRNLRARLLDPDFITQAERDLYFNREYAKPDKTTDTSDTSPPHSPKDPDETEKTQIAA